MALESTKSEVKQWLQVTLKHENLEHFSLEIVGNSEKGQGYMGDIMFVIVNGRDRHYNLVLKCSKPSKSLIENNPIMRLTYSNEIYAYERLFPTFKQFQVDLGVQEPFDSVPKCYGVFQNEARYVVALENLKQAGYDTWDEKHPLTRKHIDLVVKEYGKFHAVSVAMREKEPGKFQELAKGCKNVLGMLLGSEDLMKVHTDNVKYVYELIKDEVESEIAQKWRSVDNQLDSLLRSLDGNNDGLKVIVHGDCWNNNFMFKNEGDNTKVVIIDWQLAKLSSPLTDLSYFLFSCTLEEDVDDLDSILKTYYDSFIGHLKCMGYDYGTRYSFENLLKEWKKYFIYGAVLSLLALKGGFMEKEDIPDVGANADEGKDFVENFDVKLSDKAGYVKRVLPLVKYTVRNFSE